MGLQSSLNDVSSDSIPLLMVAIVAHWVGYLRSLLFGFIHSIGLSRIDADEAGNGIYGAVGSGLAGIIVLAEQLNMNRTFSYGYRGGEGRGGVGTVGGSDYCVVCQCRLADGDRVRRLPCRHVFHKECLDGWLDRLNWNCPLCRSPLVWEHHVADTRRRVALDLATWFPLR